MCFKSFGRPCCVSVLVTVLVAFAALRFRMFVLCVCVCVRVHFVRGSVLETGICCVQRRTLYHMRCGSKIGYQREASPASFNPNEVVDGPHP